MNIVIKNHNHCASRDPYNQATGFFAVPGRRSFSIANNNFWKVFSDTPT